MARSRARSADQKDDRRRQMKDAARAVLDEGRPVTSVTMAEVIGRTGLVKGTAYLYFPTKEALFLEVLTEDLAAWFGEVGAALRAVPTDAAPDALAGVIADTLVARPRLVRLLACLHAVLEANLDRESARAFKVAIARGLTDADVALRPRFRGFGEGDVARLFLRTHALIVGLAGMAEPSPIVAEVLEEPGLTWLKVDLRDELAGSVAAMLRGWR